MKFKKRILTTILAISLTASVGIPVSGLAMAQDTANDDNSETENEIVFTADGGNEIISINKPEEGDKEEEKPGEQEDPEKPYHEDDYGYDLELDSKFVTLERDYAQKLTVKVKNNTKKPMNYYLKAENPNDDIYLNFVQEGSEDAPLTIEPGAEKEIELSIFLQNASQKEYSIPVIAMASNGDSGAEFEQVSRHTVDFICNHGNVSYSLVAGEIDEETLTQTYYVRNNGDDVSDLTISVGEDVSRYLSVSPLIENYYLASGEEVSFSVVPDLLNMEEDGKRSLSGNVIATACATQQTAAITFDMPENFNTIEVWRLMLYQEKNPYYTIEGAPEIQDEVYDSMSALDDSNVTKEAVADTIGVDMTTGLMENVNSSQTYRYTDSNGNEQQVKLESEIKSSETADKNLTGTITYSCRQNDKSLLFETNLHLSGSEYKEYVSDYVDEIRGLFDMKGNTVDFLDEIYRDINGTNMDETTLTFVTKLSDASWGLAGYLDSTKDLMKAINTLDKVLNGAADLFKVLDYVSIINSPEYSEEFKSKTASHLMTSLLKKGAELANKYSPLGKTFLGQGVTSGADLIEKMTDIVHNKKSNEEIGSWYRENVYGQQCTNAGSVTNYTKNSLKRGMTGFKGWMTTYSNLDELTKGGPEKILNYVGDGKGKRYAGKTVEIHSVNKFRLAQTDTEENDPGDNSNKNENEKNNEKESEVKDSFVVVTGRVSGVEEDYTDSDVTEQMFVINGNSLGSINTDGLTELFMVGLYSDYFNYGEVNEVERVFNTNPGSHTIDTDTEYNTLIPFDAKIVYTDSLDSIEDIRSLPDFAIYSENISSDRDVYVGDNNEIKINIYNRGPLGGWTDVDVTVDGQIVYHEENVHMDGFSEKTVTFDYTPTNDTHTVEVTLTNKTVDVDERTVENNKAEKTLKFKRYEVPEISEITPTTLTLADTDEGAFVKCQINKDSTVQKVVFKVDDEVVAENEYVSGTGESSAFVPADKLTKGTHKVTAEVTYKINKTSEAVVTKTENLEVKVRETIDFEVKTNDYPSFRLLRLGNEYEEDEYEYEYDEDEDEYYGEGNSGEKIYYDEDSYELNRTKDEDNGVYKCSLYPTYDNMDLNNGDYYLLCEYDNGLELIPVSELKGKTLSMEGAKKITVERTEDFSGVRINRTGKINGVQLEYNYYLNDYNDYLMVGDGIESIELNTSFYVSGAYDSQNDELDIKNGDNVIILKDNTKKISLSNYSGNVNNKRLLIYSGDNYSELYSNNSQFDGQYTMFFTADENKRLQQSDKAILYFRDDDAIYEIDLKTLPENKADLAELRNDYNSINYVYDSEKIQIISRTIKRKIPAYVSYNIDKDSIKAATGEYTVTTKYRSNGTVLEDVQEIVVSGTDVDIILPAAAENLTTVSVKYPDFYTSVYLEWYDDKWSWHSERIEESGDKIVMEPGEHDYTISASTYDDVNVSLKRSVDVAEKTNTEIKIGENFAANVHISNIGSNNTNIFETTKGSDVEFNLSNFKDEYGSDLYNYNDYSWYSDNNTEAKLILTSVNDSDKKYEVGYNSDVSYISGYGKNLTFSLPEEIEGDYNYKIMMTRVVPDPPIPLEEIKLDKNELTMEPDSEDELAVTYIPEDTTWSKVVWWESSDDEIVTVEDGKLRGLKEGTATITVHSDEDYWISDSCEVTVKHTHDMQTVLAKDPKCTEDGNIEYYICSKCEKWYEDKEGAKEITDKASVVIPMTGHDHEESVTKEAGCVEIGIKTFTCKNDPTHNYTEDIPATGHEWNDWQVIKEATEFEEGTRTRTCKRDASHIETEVIPKLEHVHNMIFVKAVEPTCDTTGIKAHYVCTGCQLLFEDEQGDMKIEDKNSVVLTAIGHEWGDWTVSKEPSCTEKGSEVRICKNDSNHREEQEIPPKGHSLIKTESKAPTCEKDGNIEYYTCSECGEIYKDSEGTQVIKETEIITPAIGHNWSDWTMSLPATCTSSGEEIRTCNNGAPHSETRNTEPLGHAWGEWKVTKEATENENGERTRVCANDLNHIDIEIIPETGSQNEDSGSEEQKPEEQKPEEQKPEEQKPEEQKTEEQKPEEQKPEEQKPEEQKPEEQKPEEQKPEEQKPEEQKPEEQKPEEQKPEEQKPEEEKPEEQKPEEQKPEEQKPEEEKPEEEKPEEQKPEEQKRVDIDNKDNDSEKEITNSKVKTITNADEPVVSDDTSVEKYSRDNNKVIEYKAEAVHTGDKNNLGWIIALSFSAVGIMAALIVFLNNRKKHNG